MKRIIYTCMLLLSLFLFVTTSAQPLIIVTGTITGFHVEAVAELSTYNAHILNDNVFFQYDLEYLHINSADTRVNPVTCEFTPYDAWHKHVKQTCTITHFLIVNYNNSVQFCAVPLFAWQTMKIGQLVTMSVTSSREYICAV